MTPRRPGIDWGTLAVRTPPLLEVDQDGAKSSMTVCPHAHRLLLLGFATIITNLVEAASMAIGERLDVM